MTFQVVLKVFFKEYFFFVAILIGVIIYGISLCFTNNRVHNEGNGVEIHKYTDMDLIYMKGHPLINDMFDSAKEFYADVDKDKVKVISVAEHTSIERKLKTLTSDKTILYLIKHPTHKDFVGTVQINLFSSELTTYMDLEKAVELLTDYLPSEFSKYYKQDYCYKYTQGNVDVYRYSCHLNDYGIECHNNGHPELSFYYSMEFVHYTDTNQWKLETNYSANGGPSFEWIEKYAETWDIDMYSYL